MIATEPFRIVAQGLMLTPNIATQYGLEDARGYQAITLARYHDTFPLWSVAQPVWSNRVDDLSAPMLSLMNVRFALAPPHAKLPASWISRASFSAYQVAENRNVLPRAFVPRRVHVGVTSDESLKAMANARDFADEAWIESGERATIDNGPGEIDVQERGSNLAMHATMAGGGWVIVSEPAWRGWHALEGRRELRVHHANEAFIAFYLPQGEHQIELVYRPLSFLAGAWITASTLALFFCAFAFMARIRFARVARPLAAPLEPIGAN